MARPCVVGNLHYARIPAGPVEVDESVAAPLVASGDLVAVDSGEQEPEAPHRRRSSKG